MPGEVKNRSREARAFWSLWLSVTKAESFPVRTPPVSETVVSAASSSKVLS